MQAIARRGEVSKPTLYHYIGNKEETSLVVLDQGRTTIFAPLKDPADTSMVSVLWNFSWGHARNVLAPDNLSIARLVIGEAERVPDIVKRFHEAEPARALNAIVEYLETLRADGHLSVGRADLAAEDLWSLIPSGPRSQALHFPQNSPDDAALTTSILNGLQMFMRAYATNPASDLAALADIGQQTPPRRPT
jgi:AcrR family transcriptional regulator